MNAINEVKVALKRWIRPGTALLVAAAVGGCGNVTAGGFSQTDAYMSGDADGGGSAPAAASQRDETGGGPAAATPSATVVGTQLDGEVQATASLYLLTGGGSPVSLTPDGDTTVTVDLAGAQEPKVASTRVTAGSYTGVRVVFKEVAAVVTGGLEIGGVPFMGPVSVTLDGPDLVVDRTLPVTANEDAVLELLVDLNSAAWLDLLDPVTGTVTAADFGSAIGVSVR